MSLILAFLAAVIYSGKALANPACAVCTVAVGASLEIARKLGVDDSVVGVWAGAFLTLLGFWLIKWFDKKGWNFKGRDFWLIVISVAMIGFVYISEIEYTAKPILIFYLDPFLFSVIIGMLVASSSTSSRSSSRISVFVMLNFSFTSLIYIVFDFFRDEQGNVAAERTDFLDHAARQKHVFGPRR